MAGTIQQEALGDSTHDNLYGFIQQLCIAVICAALNVCQCDC